ncbi:MAG TPA: hypothetical protein VFI31_27325 [Pirellulales bacterium]|nr:hypothetical protein [Pirellulales bacterium]
MKRKRKPKARVQSEPRTVEVITVGWMLTVITTLACEVGFVISRWLAGDERSPLMVLSGLLLFAALVIGVVALLILPVVLRSRRVPPPSGVVVFAVVVSAAPLAMAAMEVLNR